MTTTTTNDVTITARWDAFDAVKTEAAHELALALNDARRLDEMCIQLRETATRRRMDHAADIAKIGEALITEANDRDWCEAYDRVIDELNADLVMPLPTRERDYEVQIRVTYETTVTVTARSKDEARERAEEFDVAPHHLYDPEIEFVGFE